MDRAIPMARTLSDVVVDGLEEISLIDEAPIPIAPHVPVERQRPDIYEMVGSPLPFVDSPYPPTSNV